MWLKCFRPAAAVLHITQIVIITTVGKLYCIPRLPWMLGIQGVALARYKDKTAPGKTYPHAQLLVKLHTAMPCITCTQSNGYTHQTFASRWAQPHTTHASAISNYAVQCMHRQRTATQARSWLRSCQPSACRNRWVGKILCQLLVFSTVQCLCMRCVSTK